MVKESISQKIAPEITPEAQKLIASVNADGELLRLLRIRVPELISYQNLAYAAQYIELVKEVLSAETTINPNNKPLTEAVARYLFKLMAYKDEYEVARLHLGDQFHNAIEQEFGPNVKMSYMLHPPIFRALGLKSKIKLGRWFDTVYRMLYRMRGLRGTALDIFGYAKVRKVERQLILDYRAIIRSGIKDLSQEKYDKLMTFARLPDKIRGYEEIKLNNVEKFYEDTAALGFRR